MAQSRSSRFLGQAKSISSPCHRQIRGCNCGPIEDYVGTQTSMQMLLQLCRMFYKILQTQELSTRLFLRDTYSRRAHPESPRLVCPMRDSESLVSAQGDTFHSQLIIRIQAIWVGPWPDTSTMAEID